MTEFYLRLSLPLEVLVLFREDFIRIGCYVLSNSDTRFGGDLFVFSFSVYVGIVQDKLWPLGIEVVLVIF